MNEQSSDKIILPISSRTEELETISRNKLSALFDPALFEIRHEQQRDKGVDILIEVKQNGYYTNFRSAIQLKATASIEANTDQSFSIAVKTSNIHYMVNFGMTAFYILYEHRSGLFYIEDAYHVYKALLAKYGEAQPPDSFNIRFEKLLDKDGIRGIYKQTYEKGILLKQLNTQAMLAGDAGSIKSMVIDETSGVYSVEQNIAFIEHCGFMLIHQAEFKRITVIEQRSHPRSNPPPIFNLVCGIAYFQQANLYKALDFLRMAEKASAAFDDGMRAMLEYTLLHVKYLAGFITENAFKEGLSRLANAPHATGFFQLEKAYEIFKNSVAKDANRLDKLYQDVDQIIKKDTSNPNLRIMGYLHIIEAEAKILASDLYENMVLVCGRVNNIFETDIYKSWIALANEYTVRLVQLGAFVLEQKNYIVLSTIYLDQVRWAYMNTYLSHALSNWDKDTLTIKGVLGKKSVDFLLLQVEKLDKLAESYKMLAYVEDLVTCLSLKYELLHFAGLNEKAGLIAQEILEIIKTNDLQGRRPGYERLVHDGADYQNFITFFTNKIKQIYKVAFNSGLGEYFQSDLTPELLGYIEKDTHWTIKMFYPFEFLKK